MARIPYPARPLWLLLPLLLALAACAPQASAPTGAEAAELRRLAEVAYHRMEVGRLETGAYTTNALIDMELPQGVRWTLEEYSSDSYRLRFLDDDLPEVAWLVSPAGVQPAAGEGGA